MDSSEHYFHEHQYSPRRNDRYRPNPIPGPAPSKTKQLEKHAHNDDSNNLTIRSPAGINPIIGGRFYPDQ